MSNLDNDHLRVVVIYSGTVWKTKVNTSTKISKLISLSLSHFLGSGTNSKSSKYSAVLVRNRTSLSDKKSVADMGLKDNGTAGSASYISNRIGFVGLKL